MIFMLSLFALAAAAGSLGVVIGLAYGIEVEKKRKPLRDFVALVEEQQAILERERAG